MSAAPDKDGRFGRLANCWESFKGWGRKYFDRDDQSCGVWWFMAGLFDAITLVSMVQAAAEPVWLVPAGLDGGWGAETYHVELTYTERVLLYVGMAILIALRATNRFVKIGSHLAIFFVFGQLVFTSVCYGMFMSSLRDKKILIPMEAAEGYISALITIVCAACSLPLHIIDASLGCPNDMVSLPKRDMLLATLLAMTTYLVGGAVYEAMEGWKYHESFYFCIVFLTTIGYGHLNVKTRGGYVFSIFYGIFGITMTVNLIEW
ncbi:hypothetical protein DFJ74DRAFT_645468 [Hyaloraphidium curvatum]|nr:hypothetical protein DFJ74DRAFT_645468 [Hyaloraphidium curvatum]